MAKTIDAGTIRARALELIQGAPNGLTTAEVLDAIYGQTNDDVVHKRRTVQVSAQLRILREQKHLTKKGGLRGRWIANAGRPAPEVSDIPKRAYKRKASPENGTPNAGVAAIRALLIKQIRDALDMLESAG